MSDAIARAYVGFLRKDPDPEQHVVEGILGAGAAAVPYLVEILEDQSLWGSDAPLQGLAPANAAMLLADIGDERAIPPLMRVYLGSDRDHPVHEVAFDSLALAFDEAAFAEALDRLARAGSGEERARLAWLIAEFDLEDGAVSGAMREVLHGHPAFLGEVLAEAEPHELLTVYRDALDATELGPEPWKVRDRLVAFAEAIEDLGGELTEAQQQKVATARQANARRLAELAAEQHG